MSRGAAIAAGCLLWLAAACPGAQAARSFDRFEKLSAKKKEKLVWDLHESQQFGKPEHKPICRDLLAAQGSYAHANGPAWTLECIDLAEKHEWTDLKPMIEAVYAHPRDAWLYERSFRYIRASAGKLAPDDFLQAVKTIETSAAYRSSSADAVVNDAKARLRREPDKELAMVYAFRLALSSPGKGGADRARNAGVELLKALDPLRVRPRLRQFQKDFDPAYQPDLSAIAAELRP